MKNKLLVVLIFIMVTGVLSAQTKEQALKALKKIDRPDQIEAFKSKYSNWKIQQINTLGIDSVKNQKVINAPIGEVFTRQYDDGKVNVVFKVLARRNEEICKVKYIFFDGSKISMEDIDSLRASVLKKYKSGVEFTTLANEYTMDGNPTGDLDWFYTGMMVEEFETKAMTKSKGDIFTVDVDSRDWYYVVFKTHANKNTTVTESIGILYSK